MSQTMSPAMKKAKQYHAWQWDLIKPFVGKRVLEAGAGFGQYTRLLHSHGCEIMVVDNEASHFQDILKDAPRTVCQKLDLCAEKELATAIKNFSPESIILQNVLEHIYDDEKLLLLLFQNSIPGACLILIVPSGPLLYNQLDRDAGHFRRDKKVEILRKISAAGWEARQCTYFNLLGTAGWLLAGCLSVFQKKKNSLQGGGINFLIQKFDKYLTRISRWIDALTGNRAGLSLFCVAFKR